MSSQTCSKQGVAGVVNVHDTDTGAVLSAAWASVDGVPELRGLTVTPGPGGTFTFRWLTATIRRHLQPHLDDHVDRLAAQWAPPGLGAAVADELRARRPGHVWDKAFLGHVAQLYEDELAAAGSADPARKPRPRLAVARGLSIGPDTASKAIRKARDAGMLTDTHRSNEGKG